MRRSFHLLLTISLLVSGLDAQARTPERSKTSSTHAECPPAKNVILMIGDGMGLAHVTAAMLRNGAPLAIERAQYVGLQKTHSASSDVTDSAAAGTALATGTKTNNRMIGVTPDGTPLRSIREQAQANGLATGVVAVNTVADATPAAFVAHNIHRKNEEEISEDFLRSNIDLFIGGGIKTFEKREDGRNLSNELRRKGYTVIHSLDSLPLIGKCPAGALLAEHSMPRAAAGRGAALATMTTEALRLLPEASDKGFFVMIEGSQIDNGGHENNAEVVYTELMDFDAAVRIAMDFADRTPGTLVIVTGDHETGGMSLPANENKQEFGKTQPGDRNHAVEQFSTGGHTASMIPVYTYGACAEQFIGIMDNTDIPKRIAKVLRLQ